MIYFVFYARYQVILPQASEEYGPICHYYVVVVPENVETNLMNPDEFLNQKVRIGKNDEHDESTGYVRRSSNLWVFVLCFSWWKVLNKKCYPKVNRT